MGPRPERKLRPGNVPVVVTSAIYDPALDLTRESCVSRRHDMKSRLAVFAELVPQGADRNTEDVRRMRAVAEAMIERVENEIALDIGDRASDEPARGGSSRLDRRLDRARKIGRTGRADDRAVGETDRFRHDLRAG